MRAVLIFGLALVAVAASEFVEVSRGYHEEVGIPLAAQIKAYEESLQQQPETKDGRVVGGVVSQYGAHPYFVGLLINFVNIGGQSVCGASLLSANRAVTAAHCWFDGNNQASQFTTIFGTNLLFSGGVRIVTNQVFMHPWWTPSNLGNDIAMIHIPQNVGFTTLIQPIAIPNANEVGVNFVGQWATAAGFGRTSDAQVGASTIVSEVNIQVISVAQCQATFGTNFVQQSTICTNGAGGVGICQGDSGGPLVTTLNNRRVLIGVSSFVAAAGCQLGHPSAFARVTSFRDFIMQHL